jgi:ferritin-like metal-binding protein YciE
MRSASRIAQDSKGPILDLVIVASMQRIEHYEIAAYGTDVAHGKGARRKRGGRSSDLDA